MSNSTIRQNPRRLSDSSVSDLENYLQTTPAVIIPVGSLEPIGKHMPLGLIADTCDALAEHISMNTGALVAPKVSYGYATPFKAFAGCTGISEKTFANTLSETCNGLFFQGFKRILLITLGSDHHDTITTAINYMKKKGEIAVCILQKNEQFRLLCARKCKTKEPVRTEWGMLALAQSFISDYADLQLKKPVGPLPDKKQYATWYKKGKDPQKLRKLVPDMRLSPFYGIIAAEDAQELKESTIALLLEKYLKFLTVF